MIVTLCRDPQISLKQSHLVTCHKAILMGISQYPSNVGRLSVTIWLHCEVIWWLFVMKLSWWKVKVKFPKDGHVTVTRWLHCIARNNSDDNFSMESPNDNHLRIIMKRVIYITLCFTLVTLKLVTICNIKVMSHRLVVPLGRYLFITLAV